MAAAGGDAGPGRGDGPAEVCGFEIRIKGRVAETVREAFRDLNISVRPVETVLSGSPLDQAALYAILDLIQSLGLELVEVRRLSGGGRDVAGAP